MLLADDHGINFGDLVHVAGYGDRPFFVDNWTVKINYTPDAEWTETWFDITCAHTGEYHLAELEDITKVCDAAQADDYLLYHASPYVPDMMLIGSELDFGNKPKEGSKMYRKPERKPTQRELSNQEAERRKQARKERKQKIDVLLDEYNDTKILIEKFGDEEYKAKAEYLLLKLTELSEEGSR